MASFATALTAMTGGQSGALPVTADRNVFTAVPPGGGAILTAVSGMAQTIYNRCRTGQALLVYPIASMSIEAGEVNDPIEIADGGQATFLNATTKFLMSGS